MHTGADMEKIQRWAVRDQVMVAKSIWWLNNNENDPDKDAERAGRDLHAFIFGDVDKKDGDDD